MSIFREPIIYEIEEELIEKNTKSLKKNGVNQTGINELLDISKHNLDMQYTRKSHLENRSGFGLTLWGLITSVFFLSTGEINNIPLPVLIMTGISAVVSIISFLVCVWSSDYSSPTMASIDDLSYSINDMEVFFVQEWNLLNKCIFDNEKVIHRKSTALNIGMAISVLYGTGVFLGFLWR
ncbi:hypothetical protein [Pseudobutyrivibrio xylanivorans]|uniref:Uncharacterized protein n=1 Tax=Pseudobutyrivibrio xylanivorans TaxID=185007 RepID=A0A5P6VSU4_PSEXY|nr:hypothetical protein [Pseudobutyrivibrio xylanivorans]QFJ54799.1 hypothetical protein FXF36_08010 [Pseudobutyrivibrio xylanivorans]